MSEELVIRHCSPTLAGLKTGSLFNCHYENAEEITKNICALNQRLVPKGLRIIPIRFLDHRVLVYVYRPGMLKRDLAEKTARKILEEKGYIYENSDQCVVQLVRRLRTESNFPHEIGLFLGYPPEDVRGFIEKKDECKCVGCWKVYGDEHTAKCLFAKYKKCTEVYCEKWRYGRSIEKLTVSR